MAKHGRRNKNNSDDINFNEITTTPDIIKSIASIHVACKLPFDDISWKNKTISTSAVVSGHEINWIQSIFRSKAHFIA